MALTKFSTSGENAKVPIPEPHTAIPVAKDRLFSKYPVTHTIAGRYIRPNPRPVDQVSK